MSKITFAFISILLITLTAIAYNQSFAQTNNETGWKNYTNNYFNLTIEIPSGWKVTDETTRFYDDKNLYFDYEIFDKDRLSYSTFARMGIWPVDITDAKGYLEDEKEYDLSINGVDGTTIKIIEDIQENKYNISSVPSYSYLYLATSEVGDNVGEIITFIHNGQGYKLFTMVAPPNYFDEPQYSEDLRRVLNSIKLDDANKPSPYYLFVSKYGELGSAHEHAALLINLNGTNLDLAQQPYMVRSNYIHIESFNGKLDGTTIHKHSTKVPMSEFFKSIKMDISNGCFITDTNQRYCDNEDYNLRYYVNGNETKDIMNYVLQDDDRILITYGKQNSNEIKDQLRELNTISINKK
ncbi:MAG: hypothetical protein L0H53_12080 [Candidatus Nitrosocosmicus sp.]|nr:hypothetical protein [Candidatus Nitrosocosmicus sp.]MDN5866786.1 hypothetical protein [Candidatus Nitrosocosmicus sp.]